MPGIRIVKVSRVNLPPDSCSSRSKRSCRFLFLIYTGSHSSRSKISCSTPTLTYALPLSTLSNPLSRKLSLFHMLAGRLAYLPASDDVVLDSSSDGCGAFVEAVSEIDVRHIAEDDVHDTGAFLKLVAEITADEMPVPVLEMLVTAFVGGRAAVGVSIHHAAEAWAAECRRDCPAAQDPASSHDQAVIAVPAKDAIAKRYLSFLAPNRPKLPPTSNKSLQDRLRLTRRSFTRNATAIQSLKRRAMRPLHEKRISPLSRTPSTFQALAAHSWVSLVLAKGLACDAAACDSPAFLLPRRLPRAPHPARQCRLHGQLPSWHQGLRHRVGPHCTRRAREGSRGDRASSSCSGAGASARDRKNGPRSLRIYLQE